MPVLEKGDTEISRLEMRRPAKALSLVQRDFSILCEAPSYEGRLLRDWTRALLSQKASLFLLLFRHRLLEQRSGMPDTWL